MVKQVGHQQVLDLLEHGANLMDVLPHAEYEESHIQGARSLPLKELHTRSSSLDESAPVIVYCAGAL
jgi:rhodanese-related sulfurtransferase